MTKRTDTLRRILEEEILTGRTGPGDRLDEVALAERFGVSRPPVREALFQPGAASLIENRLRRGALVTNAAGHDPAG